MLGKEITRIRKWTIERQKYLFTHEYIQASPHPPNTHTQEKEEQSKTLQLEVNFQTRATSQKIHKYSN